MPQLSGLAGKPQLNAAPVLHGAHEQTDSLQRLALRSAPMQE